MNRGEDDMYYPMWLAPSLLGGYFPWDDAAATTMPKFAQVYDLHDCYWIGLWSVPDVGAIAIVRCWPAPMSADGPRFEADEVYTEEEERQYEPWRDHSARGNPIFLFRFNQLYQFEQRNDPEDPEGYMLDISIYEVASRPLVGDEFHRWRQVYTAAYDAHGRGSAEIAEGEVCETIFEGSENYAMVLHHGAPVDVLLMNPLGRVIPLPGL